MIVSTIVAFVVMVFVVHHVCMAKMLKKLMVVVVWVHVLYGGYYQDLVYVVYYIWTNEKLYVIVIVFKRIVMIAS